MHVQSDDNTVFSLCQAFREGSRKSSRVKVNQTPVALTAAVDGRSKLTIRSALLGCGSRAGANRAPVFVGEQDQDLDGAL